MRRICKELNKLPKDIRNKVFDNTDVKNFTDSLFGEKDLSGIISGAFLWDRSPEGFGYWVRIHEKYG